MSAFARATGIGSWPGTSAREAAKVVVGELHQLTHLVELPARGVGADLIGRAGALLVDIAIGERTATLTAMEFSRLIDELNAFRPVVEGAAEAARREEQR